MIPEDKKDIVQSLVDSYADGSHSTQYDDIIQGKGRSLVVLLQYEVNPSSVFPVISSLFGPVVPLGLERH